MKFRMLSDQKKAEKDMAIKRKLAQMSLQQELRNDNLRQKFENQEDKGLNKYQQSKIDKMIAQHEFHEYKVETHKLALKRVKHVQSLYKQHLIAKSEIKRSKGKQTSEEV